MNKWGMHTPNEGFRNLEAFYTLGVSNFTGLEISFDRTYEESPDKHSIGRELRNRCPEARILVRFYGWSEGGHIVLSRWSDVDPIAWARQCAEWANSHRWLTDHFALANEMNLPAEGGGWTKEWYQRINDWLVLAITEFRCLCPWVIIHWPALASGHSDDQDDPLPQGAGDGTIGLEICAPSIRLCDVVDHHDYWHTPEELFESELADWYAFRFKRAREVLLGLGIDKPMLISECGWYGQHEANPEAGQHLIYFFEQLYDYPYILGATPFIWDSDDAHVGQRIGRCATTWWPIQSADKQEVEPVSDIIDIVGRLPRHTTLRYDTRPLTSVDTWIVHHNGRGSDMLAPSVVANYHVDEMGWPSIAYHYYILGDGTIYRTNYETTHSWHAGDADANKRGCGIVLAGCYTDTWPSTEQLNSLEKVIALHPTWEVKGHCEVKPTECPGKWFFDWRGNGDVDEDAIYAWLDLLEERIEAVELQIDKVKEAWR